MPRKPLEAKLNTKPRNFLDELQKIDTKPVEMKNSSASKASEGESEEISYSADAQSEDTLPKIKSAKMKVNLYIETVIKRRTEKIQNELREMAPQDSASRINYSMIVETALQIVFEDFNRTREKSRLYEEITKQLRNK